MDRATEIAQEAVTYAVGEGRRMGHQAGPPEYEASFAEHLRKYFPETKRKTTQTSSGVDWCLVDMKSKPPKVSCSRCGGQEAFHIPVLAKRLFGTLDAFQENHKNCEPHQ